MLAWACHVIIQKYAAENIIKHLPQATNNNNYSHATTLFTISMDKICDSIPIIKNKKAI